MARKIRTIHSGSESNNRCGREKIEEDDVGTLVETLNTQLQQASDRNTALLSKLNQSQEDKLTERNLRLHAEEAMRKAYNRADDLLERLKIFQDFVGSALSLKEEHAFIEYSLETIAEVYGMEVAAFFELDSDANLKLIGGFDLDYLPDNVLIQAVDVNLTEACLITQHASSYPLMQTLKLQEGMVCPFKGKDKQGGGLLVTGNTASGIGIYQTPNEDHLSLFAILCAQIGALWENRFLEALARHDGLTSLFNQRSFYEELDRESSRSQRSGDPLSLVYLDLDGFKDVNDSLGHQVGDEILVIAADSLMSTKRAQDVVARYGGDEFCALLPNTSASRAKVFAQRLIDNFKARIGDYQVSMSIGIATSDSPEADALVKAADAMMYRSKKRKGYAITVME